MEFNYGQKIPKSKAMGVVLHKLDTLFDKMYPPMVFHETIPRIRIHRNKRLAAIDNERLRFKI